MLNNPGTSLACPARHPSDTPPPAELRARFDNGEDPNDPMAQQGGQPFPGGPGGAQFAQFFQQGFGGGGGGGGGFPGGFQFHFSRGGH